MNFFVIKNYGGHFNLWFSGFQSVFFLVGGNNCSSDGARVSSSCCLWYQVPISEVFRSGTTAQKSYRGRTSVHVGPIWRRGDIVGKLVVHEWNHSGRCGVNLIDANNNTEMLTSSLVRSSHSINQKSKNNVDLASSWTQITLNLLPRHDPSWWQCSTKTCNWWTKSHLSLRRRYDTHHRKWTRCWKWKSHGSRLPSTPRTDWCPRQNELQRCSWSHSPWSSR